MSVAGSSIQEPTSNTVNPSSTSITFNSGTDVADSAAGMGLSSVTAEGLVINSPGASNNGVITFQQGATDNFIWLFNGFGNFQPSGDNLYGIANSSNRITQISAILYKVFAASGDANPTVQLGNGVIQFGPGGATALNATYKITTPGVQTLYTNAAPATLTYTPPATAGVYRISAYLNILTGATQTFKIKITYKDPGGNAVTDIPDFEQQNSVTLLAGSPGANVTGRFWFVAVIAIDNSATAITVADNAGTYTAGTYYWTPILEQLA